MFSMTSDRAKFVPQFRRIDGDAGLRVGSDGSVWTCRDASGTLTNNWHRVLMREQNGMLYIQTQVNGVLRHLSVSKLVYSTFVGPVAEGTFVAQKDGNRHNNSHVNLELRYFIIPERTCRSRCAKPNTTVAPKKAAKVEAKPPGYYNRRGPNGRFIKRK